jgi:hypothetical protein
LAGVASLFVVPVAAGVVGSAASPSRWSNVKLRVRRTDAVQFCSWITNWYCPVSSKLMALSVAEMVVMTLAWRGSPADVLHTLRQPRAPAEWLRR